MEMDVVGNEDVPMAGPSIDDGEVVIKKELLFGSTESGGFLDILATVATEQLDKLSEIKQEPLQEGSAKRSLKKATDHRIPYTQICRMSLNSVVFHFAEFHHRFSQGTFSYKCRLMPPHDAIGRKFRSFSACDYQTKSFRNEQKAKSHIKQHLQSHIKYILKLGDYEFSSLPTKIKSESVDVKSEPVFVKMEEPEEVVTEVSPDDLQIGEAQQAIMHDHCYFVTENEELVHDQDDGEKHELRDGTDEDWHIMDSTTDESSSGPGQFVENDPVFKLGTNLQASINEKPREPKPVGFSPVVGSEVILEESRRISSGSTDSGIFSEAEDTEKSAALDAIKELQKKGVSGSTDFNCTVCGKEFTAYTSLLTHLKSTHAGMKTHECHVCRKSFTRQQTLKYHMMVHQNEAKFTCDDCGRKFRHPSHFKEHLRRHQAIASFQCAICGDKFKEQTVLDDHVKTVHAAPEQDILSEAVASTIGDLFKENTEGDIRNGLLENGERTGVFKDLSNTGMTPATTSYVVGPQPEIVPSKQAFLATIDGRQVLLIPRAPSPTKEEPSKLEQCLRFGSASVKSYE